MHEKVAVYWDFENVHAGQVDQDYGEGFYRSSIGQPQNVSINVGAVMSYISSLGDVAINRAYGNWQWLAHYRQELLGFAIDLVQLFPPGMNGKNGADIRIALDCIEDSYRFQHVQQIVIIGGDSDYIPVAQKLRGHGKRVIGVGILGHTNRFWIRACNEFKYYHTLLTRSEAAPEASSPAMLRPLEAGDEASAAPDMEAARRLLVRALRQLSDEGGEDWILKSRIKPMMIRMEPDFDEGNYGFTTFRQFLEATRDLVQVRRGDKDHLVALAESTEPQLRVVPPMPARLPTASPQLTLDDLHRQGQSRFWLDHWRRVALAAMVRTLRETPQPLTSWEQLEARTTAQLLALGVSPDREGVTLLRKALYKARRFRIDRKESGQLISIDGSVAEESLRADIERIVADLRTSAAVSA